MPRFLHTSIFVNDMNESIEFYTESSDCFCSTVRITIRATPIWRSSVGIGTLISS
jgi:catechol 2,3-dioxygenase-like lactoylglutathione lyase family enzyme